MASICEYCQSPCEDGQTSCPNCGAPVTHAAAPAADFRVCPFCSHKLIALGSPACSYCGHRLPDEYIKAREADLSRITQIEGDPRRSDTGPAGESIADTLRMKSSGSATAADLLLDITNIFVRR
jgi:hypothetical protein